MRRRPGEKGNAEANHSQLWHKAQVSCVAPGKQQCQGLLGKVVGFFPASACKVAGPVSRYQLTTQTKKKKEEKKRNHIQTASLVLQLSGMDFTRSHLLKPPSHLSS